MTSLCVTERTPPETLLRFHTVSRPLLCPHHNSLHLQNGNAHPNGFPFLVSTCPGLDCVPRKVVSPRTRTQGTQRGSEQDRTFSHKPLVANFGPENRCATSETSAQYRVPVRNRAPVRSLLRRTWDVPRGFREHGDAVDGLVVAGALRLDGAVVGRSRHRDLSLAQHESPRVQHDVHLRAKIEVTWRGHVRGQHRLCEWPHARKRGSWQERSRVRETSVASQVTFGCHILDHVVTWKHAQFKP